MLPKGIVLSTCMCCFERVCRVLPGMHRVTDRTMRHALAWGTERCPMCRSSLRGDASDVSSAWVLAGAVPGMDVEGERNETLVLSSFIYDDVFSAMVLFWMG
eukprot:m.258963 g.258963  ORF g.258963 m.258963 type:complete len:102 (+) comp19654_c0_seq17:101-406(+)